nr:hypothetical protein [Janibacter melonis]
MAHEDALLAVRGELGPVRRDRRVEVDETALDEQEDGERRDLLRRRPHVDDRVPLPRPGAGDIGVPAPDIDEGLAIEVDADRGAELLARGDHGLEGVAQARQAWVGVPVDGHGISFSSAGPRAAGAARADGCVACSRR